METIETLTPQEVSVILKLHPFTVARLAREGKIPAFKAGGVWRFRKDHFEQWMDVAGQHVITDPNSSDAARKNISHATT